MTQGYFEKDQYKDSSKLAKRANLHVKYGKGDWFGWLAERAGFEPGMRVLDIGCGAGWFWQEVTGDVPAGLDLTLADISSGMVDEALDRVQKTGHRGDVNGLVADVCNLPFADGGFDRVLGLHMLYHAQDQPRALAQIARVMKPDGVALISTNGAANMAAADRLRQKVFDLLDTPVINFTLESAPALLEPRFTSVELQARSDVMHVTDEQDLFDFLTSFPPGDAASSDQQAALGDLIARRFAQSGGVFDLETEVGVFICRK